MRQASVRPLVSALEFAALPTAVPCARLHSRAIMQEWGFDRLTETVQLVVSELVTNAIAASNSRDTRPRYEQRPGMPAVGLRLSAERGSVLIEVWDDVPIVPTRRDAVTSDDESGRGLMLVEALCERWGWYEPEGQRGKVVWAEVGLDE